MPEFPIFDLSINIITLLVIIGLSVFTGFGIQRWQIAKKNRKIKDLEQEVIEVSAEILEVQKEYCELEARIKDMDLAIPVIPIKLRVRKEEEQTKGTKEDGADLKKDSRNRTA